MSELFCQNNMWACLAEREGFNTPGSAGGLNFPDKRVDPGCWMGSGFESHGATSLDPFILGSFRILTAMDASFERH